MFSFVPVEVEVDVASDQDEPPVVLDEYCSPVLLLPDLCRRLNRSPKVACRESEVCTPTESLVDELFPRVVLSDVDSEVLVPWE